MRILIFMYKNINTHIKMIKRKPLTLKCYVCFYGLLESENE